jgi:hypothetical protein
MARISPGSVDVSRYIILKDTAGNPATGYTVTALDLYYVRDQSPASTKVDATALAAIDSEHADNKAIEISAVGFPGLYRVDWPDAAFAAGKSQVMLSIVGPGLQPCIEEIELKTDIPAILALLEARLTAARAAYLDNLASAAALKALLADIDMTDQDDITKLLGQIRMSFVHEGGTEVRWDPETPNEYRYRNEANDADLSVKTRSTGEDNIEKVTRSAP